MPFIFVYFTLLFYETVIVDLIKYSNSKSWNMTILLHDHFFIHDHFNTAVSNITLLRFHYKSISCDNIIIVCHVRLLR